MIYKFSITNDNNKVSIFYLTSDNTSKLYRRIFSTYGVTKDRVKILAEIDDSEEKLVVKKSYEEAKKISSKTLKKVDEIYSKLTKKCEPHKSAYINKYAFSEIKINQKEDLYDLVDKYKKVKVYWETGPKRGTKNLYALVKN